ncbi:MAG: DUF3006 domain-containing protein [Proteobacteria bacterium]|nr:DUF3006 domain-containing protein [Pseudomonadota bacterium]
MIVIDSISDNIARVEFDGVFVEVPRSVLPADCKEGDVLGFMKLDNSEILKKGSDRLARMRAMSNSGGDIDL